MQGAGIYAGVRCRVQAYTQVLGAGEICRALGGCSRNMQGFRCKALVEASRMIRMGMP